MIRQGFAKEGLKASRLRRRLGAVLAALALPAMLGLVSPARGEEYPARAIRLIVPYPPGGATDILGRHLAAFLTADLKQAVIVDNRGGAQGAIGAQAAAQAAPDGYTLLVASNSLYLINPLLYKHLAYHPARDLRMLSVIGDNPLVVVVRPTLAAHNLNELIALARKEDGNLSFASAGYGTTMHMASEMLKEVTGIRMNHVPFAGSTPALNMLLAGQIDLMFADVPNALPHIRARTLRPLAVANQSRLPVLAQVPTTAEAGFTDLDPHVWFGLAGPARMPAPVAERVKAAADRALEDREFRISLEGLGFAVSPPFSAGEIDARLDAESRRWAKVVASQKISLD
jgi:tripartite-type tricarboxylate transporter receptor subunit TctC